MSKARRALVVPAVVEARPSPAPVALFGDRRLHVLPLLFAASGCSALILELVWFQWLELILGSSAPSLGILLAVFMGGMGLGSLMAPRFLPSGRSPLRLYALLELGIAAFAILVWLELPFIRNVYAALGLTGATGMAVRAVVAALCLLPPTVLMGAALPTAARLAGRSAEGTSWVGALYASNTLGAMVGCALAGFYLLRVHDMPFATLVAASLNLFAAGVSFLLGTASAPRAVTTQPIARSRFTLAHAVVLLSGFCALGGEVVWTRILALLLGSTVYTFSIILTVILLGIALGGAVGAHVAKLSRASLRNLGIAQALIIPAVWWASYLVNVSMPYWPITPGLSTNPWMNFQLDLLRCLWALLPAAALWGATIPLALAAAPASTPVDQHTGSIYAANTVGAILGALAFTFVIIPWGGTLLAQRLILWGAAAAGTLALLPLARQPFASPRALGYAMTLVGVLLATAVMTPAIARVPGELVAFGRSLAYRSGLQDPRTFERLPLPRVLYVGEGLNESVAVTTDERERLFHVSGKIEASTAPKDMRLQRMLGSLPAWIHPAPQSVLVVGFGAGVTAGTFLDYPSVKRVVICELEPLIPKRVAGYFADVNNRVATDPRVTIVTDDARHFMLTTKERFDIITSDPIHPWVKGSAVLYSKEYFDLVRRRLNPGGVVTQWVPLYQSSESTIQDELATFMRVFPGASVWANRDRGLGYDMVLLGGTREPKIDLDAVASRWDRDDHARARSSLAAVGFAGWADLLATYAGRHVNLQPWLEGAKINEDRSLHLQFQAGLESLVEQEEAIYARMIRYRSFPADLFVGSPAHVATVMEKGAE